MICENVCPIGSEFYHENPASLFSKGRLRESALAKSCYRKIKTSQGNNFNVSSALVIKLKVVEGV